MLWQDGVEVGVCANADRSFVRPSPGDIARRIATTTDNKERNIEGLRIRYAGAMATDIEIEAAQSVVAEGISATLKNDGRWAIVVHARANDSFE
jgi:hypothetical protein